MGVVNVTPDSFSDGGRWTAPGAALDHARSLIAEGADLLDIGGESTRPGSAPTDAAEQIARTAWLIAALRAETGLPLSIDTSDPAVARAAAAAGATIWNDVAALSGAPDSLETAAALRVGVVLMHMQGTPATMQHDPQYDDVADEVRRFLLARAETAVRAGVAAEAIWLDPGIGFGKRLEHNVALLAALPTLVAEGFPVVVGASRKGFLSTLADRPAPPDQRLGGSIAAALHAAEGGAAVLRVHDVQPTAQALAVWRGLKAAGRPA